MGWFKDHLLHSGITGSQLPLLPHPLSSRHPQGAVRRGRPRWRQTRRMARNSDSRRAATRNRKKHGGPVTGRRHRVMNCQLRLTLTRLYMSGQIISGCWGGRESKNNNIYIYWLPVLWPVTQVSLWTFNDIVLLMKLKLFVNNANMWNTQIKTCHQ